MHFEIYTETAGDASNLQWRWRLKADNHKIIADSGESYFNKPDCLNAIKLVMKSSEQTPVQEM